MKPQSNRPQLPRSEIGQTTGRATCKPRNNGQARPDYTPRIGPIIEIDGQIHVGSATSPWSWFPAVD